jgi:hypothetical protein
MLKDNPYGIKIYSINETYIDNIHYSINSVSVATESMDYRNIYYTRWINSKWFGIKLIKRKYSWV